MNLRESRNRSKVVRNRWGRELRFSITDRIAHQSRHLNACVGTYRIIADYKAADYWKRIRRDERPISRSAAGMEASPRRSQQGRNRPPIAHRPSRRAPPAGEVRARISQTLNVRLNRSCAHGWKGAFCDAAVREKPKP